jgi:hypothetical protein
MNPMPYSSPPASSGRLLSSVFGFRLFGVLGSVFGVRSSSSAVKFKRRAPQGGIEGLWRASRPDLAMSSCRGRQPEHAIPESARPHLGSIPTRGVKGGVQRGREEQYGGAPLLGLHAWVLMLQPELGARRSVGMSRPPGRAGTMNPNASKYPRRNPA